MRGLGFDPLTGIDVLGELGLSGLALGMRLGDEDPNSWEMWWDLNHLRLVDLDGHHSMENVVTGTSDFFLGTPAGPRIDAAPPSDLLWLRTKAAPAIAEQLESRPSALLERELLITAGRMYARARTTEQDRFDDAIRSGLASSSPDVRRSACLAAGLTGDPKWALRLAGLVLDDRGGRQLVGGGSIEDVVRADAAIALAELASRSPRTDVRRFAVHTLESVLHEPATAREDVPVACSLALALVPLERIEARDAGGTHEPASGSRLAAARRLLKLLDDCDDSRVRTHAPTAVALIASGLPQDVSDATRARLGAPLLERLSDDDGDRAQMEATIATCFGVLARPTGTDFDRAAVDALLRIAGRSPRRGSRCAAILALGRIAAEPGSAPIVDEIGSTLCQIARRGDRFDSGWACMALGEAGRGYVARDEAPPQAWGEALLAVLDDDRDPSRFTAAALASAAIGERRARRAIYEGFEGVPDGPNRLRLSLALGMLGVHDARAPIGAWAHERETDAGAAYASTLVGVLLGGQLGPVAAELAREPGAASQSEALAVTRALGELRSSDASARLLVWATDGARSGRVRAAAARALGRALRVPGEPTVAAALAEVVCYEAAPRSLLDGLGQGVLERLDP